MFGQAEALSVAGLQGHFGRGGVGESLQVPFQAEVFHSHELGVEPGTVQGTIGATSFLLVQTIQVHTAANRQADKI